MPVYESAKRGGLKYPEPTLILDFDQDFSLAPPDPYPSYMLPGDRRPIDYEFLYDRPQDPVKVAHAGFALYFLGERSGQRIYALRAEEFAPAGEYEGVILRRSPPPRSLFTVFSMPDCRYWGVMGYRTHRKKYVFESRDGEMEEIDSFYEKGSYVAELLQIQGRPYVMQFFVQPGFVGRILGRAELKLWDVLFEFGSEQGMQFRFIGDFGSGADDHLEFPADATDLIPR